MTSINQSLFTQLGLVPPPARDASAYDRIEGTGHEGRTEQSDEGFAEACFPVPLYVIAAAALLG